MNANGNRVCIAKRRRRPGGAGLALASVFILLASAALGGSLAAAATDLEKLDAKVAKSAIPVGAGFDKPKLPCVCQEGTTDDTLGAAGFLVRIAGVGRFIEGVLQKTVTVACVVQGFDASGALESTHGCTVFAVLPR
jgi:hypothetical protein